MSGLGGFPTSGTMEVNAGGVIAYISSSSSASSPASCHSDGSENSFQSSSSVPSSPTSSNSDNSGNLKNGELSNIEGILKNDRIDCSLKTSKPSAPGMTKNHSGVTRFLSKKHSAKHPVQEVPEE